VNITLTKQLKLIAGVMLALMIGTGLITALIKLGATDTQSDLRLSTDQSAPPYTAQIDRRSQTPIRLAASNSIGHSYYADRAQGLRYYREAYSAECFNLQGTTLCIAGVQDGPDEEPFFPNPEWTWS